MKSHIFRSLIAVSFAALLTATSTASQSTAAGKPAAPAQRQLYPQPMRSTSASDFVLRWDNTATGGSPYQTIIRELRSNLGFGPNEFTNPRELLAEAKRTAIRNCPQAKQDNNALRRVVTDDWFCLNKKDSNNTNWTPQGISGTWDSSRQGTVNNAHAFVFSWHYTSNEASRVTFLDEISESQQSARHKYRHVILVAPGRTSSGQATFGDVPIHTGGLIWYHQYLLAMDDDSGIYVFDMHNLLDLQFNPRANITNRNRIGLETNDIYYTGGYRYILPLIGVWRSQTSGTGCHSEHVPPCYTYAGLDRSTTPPSMLTGEWCPKKSSTCTVGRVARWTMAPDNSDCTRGCLQADGNTARAVQAFTQVHNSMQGGISWNNGSGRVYQFTRSNSRTKLGRRYAAVPNQTPTPHFAGVGVQDLYWNRTTTTPWPVLWSLTEWPGVGKRVLYGVHP